LTDDVVAAASGENPYTDLAAVATSAMEAGTEHEDVLQACSAAVLAIRTRADDEIAEDHVLDLTDRLVGWCTKHARL
jgi:hypothetical protein